MSSITPTTSTSSSTSTSTRKILILKPGDTKVLKKGIRIISVARNGSINLSTSCPSHEDALRVTEEFKCFVLRYHEDGSGGPFSKWDGLLKGFTFLNTFYPISGQSVGDIAGMLAEIQRVMPEGLLLSSSYTNVGSTDNMYAKRINLMLPASIGKTLVFHFDVLNFGPLTIAAEQCDECCPVDTIN